MGAPAKENVYYDLDEEEQKKQYQLWNDAEKKHKWYDAPPKVKVTTKNGICHMNIELTVGMNPDIVFEMFTNPNNIPFFTVGGHQLLENKSRKVLKENGPRQIAKSEENVACNFLWWSGALPITLMVDENKKDLTAKYTKHKMMFMKVFKGSYKVEPLYVDSELLCKDRAPKSTEEYKKCSGGQGKIASKVIMHQCFQPYSLLNLPPFSWCIRETIIKTTITLLKILQMRGVVTREIPWSLYYDHEKH